MKRKQLLFLLALLMTAATGAWAQSAKHVITATYDKQTRLLEQPLPYETTIGALYEAVTGEPFSDLLTTMTALEMPLKGISSNNTDVVSIGEFNDASTTVTVKADGKATVALRFGNVAQGIFVSVVPPLYVTMADGTKDAAKWTATVGTSTTANPLPVGELSEKDAVTLTYGGRLKVKNVTATTDAAAPSVPDGAISGVFSVSSTKKVYFSKGNLQATYNGSNWSWAFATNQWDYIGNAAGNTSIDGDGTISENATVDLFGWVGAACEWTGAAQYGISNVMTSNQYGNVKGEALKSEWGTLAITNGGNTANFGWHSLASSEWEYLFQTRTTPSDVRYAHATVNDVPGLVLLPDDWSTDYYSLTKVNDATGTAYTDNVISSSDWTSKLEAHGAVFLPAGGYRNGAEVSEAGVQGTYWSRTSSTNSGLSALCFFFRSAKFAGVTQNYMRNRGCSVRLVQATSDAAPAEEPVTLATPLTIEAVTPGTIQVNMSGELLTGMKYSVNGGTPTLITTTTGITVAKGDKVQFYGNGEQTQAYGDSPEVRIQGTGDGFQTKVYGNIMSLLDETGFATKTELPNVNYVFYELFVGNTTLNDASELLLPATTLAEQCYVLMFAGCTSLTTAPKLPATTLASDCYWGMFSGCTSLTSAYVKAAYTGENDECDDMFEGCTADGAVLHTTSDNKASWETKMGMNWSNWSVADDWQD